MPRAAGAGTMALWLRGAVVQPILWLCVPKAPRQRPRLPRKRFESEEIVLEKLMRSALCSRTMSADAAQCEFDRR